MDNDLLLKALNSMALGTNINGLVEKYNISINQAKKISQLKNMKDTITNLLDYKLQERFIKLGFKALVLNPLFKANDIEGIKEIIESIDPGIKRDDLKLLPEALRVKRERVAEAKKDAENQMDYLRKTEDKIGEKIKELEENKKKTDESMGFLNDIVDKKSKEFLMEHLGVAKGKIVLYKRLDIPWQQYLKQRGAIKYNKSTYTWEIIDMDELKRQTENRVKNKKDMYYDYNKASGPYESFAPEEAEYKNAVGLGFSLLEEFKKNQKELRSLKREKRDINKKLKELKGTKVQTYMGAAEVSNHLSEYEILNHRQLQNIGMRYLYKNNLVAAAEITQDHYRFDVIGYGLDGQVIIIEAKASIEDFRADDKFHKYLEYCNSMYFIFKEGIYMWHEYEIYKKIKEYNIGVLIEKGNNAVVKVSSGTWNMNEDRKHILIFDINKTLSRKFIYGR